MVPLTSETHDIAIPDLLVRRQRVDVYLTDLYGCDDLLYGE
jgi:hypothetical protein